MAMGLIVVFDTEVEELGAPYLEIVVKHARSGDGDARETRRRALKQLGRLGCRRALAYLIDQYASSGDGDEREVRRTAFDYLETIDEGKRIS